MRLEIQDVGEKSLENCRIVTWDKIEFLGLNPDHYYQRVTLDCWAGDVATVSVSRYLTPEESKKIKEKTGKDEITTTEEYVLVDDWDNDEKIKLQVRDAHPCAKHGGCITLRKKSDDNEQTKD